MRYLKTKEEFNAIVAVELIPQAEDGMKVYYGQTHGIYPLIEGDIELNEGTNVHGRPFYRIDRTPQLRERLESEYGMKNTGYDHFEYMTLDQVKAKREAMEIKLNNINNTLNQLV